MITASFATQISNDNMRFASDGGTVVTSVAPDRQRQNARSSVGEGVRRHTAKTLRPTHMRPPMAVPASAENEEPHWHSALPGWSHSALRRDVLLKPFQSWLNSRLCSFVKRANSAQHRRQPARLAAVALLAALAAAVGAAVAAAVLYSLHLLDAT